MCFLVDMGEKPSKKHSLDRIDVNGNYEPSNCRWATQSEQMRNTRVNLNITYKGVTKTFVEWCEIYNMDYLPAYKVYKRGLRTFEEIVETYKNGGRKRYRRLN